MRRAATAGRRTGPGLLTVVLLVAVVTAACGGTPTDRASTATTRPPTTGTTSTPTTSLAAGAPTTSVPAGVTPAGTWTTYGGNPGRTAVDSADPAAAGPPAAAWTSPALDGPVYGQPLVWQGRVYVATEEDTVYALDASDGRVDWSLHLATPASAGLLPCGDIGPTNGVTATMVLDPDDDTLFASAETGGGGRVGHWLYAVDLATHRVRFARDVDQPGWVAADQLQRTALTLDDGAVYLGFGGNDGDCGRYHGWVVGVPVDGTGPDMVYGVPTANQGAIWAPSGLTVDPAGNILAATGNGSAGVGQPFDHGNAVIELDPALRELQYFAPTQWAQWNQADLDLGSSAPVLVGGDLAVQIGKQADAYLLDTARLGGIGGQLASLTVCNVRGGIAAAAGALYVPCVDDGRLVRIDVGPGDRLRADWRWTAPGGSPSSPTVAGGVVWTVDLGDDTLYGVDPATGTTRFTLPLAVGTPEHFAAPAAAGGLLVVAGSEAVEAFRFAP